MQEFILQFKTNKVVQYTVMGAFLLCAFVFSGRSYFTALVAVIGILLGHFSHADRADEADV